MQQIESRRSNASNIKTKSSALASNKKFSNPSKHAGLYTSTGSDNNFGPEEKVFYNHTVPHEEI